MKKYLSFHLSGEEIFSYFLIIILIVVIPSIITSMNPDWYYGDGIKFLNVFLMIIAGIIIALIVLLLSLRIVNKTIEGIEYNSEKLMFRGSSDEYIGIVVRGILFTIVTLGIYSPWFYRDLQRFFIGKSSYKNEQFEFLGRGKELLVILVAGMIIPNLLLYAIFNDAALSAMSFSSFHAYFLNILSTAVIAPFTYYFYRWLIHVRRKELISKIVCSPGEGIGMVLIQTVIAAATLGIYFPIAILKIYRFFLTKIEVSGKGGENIKFGYNLEDGKDFLYIWGQTILTIFTIGIYGAWAYCNVMKHVLGKTYILNEE